MIDDWAAQRARADGAVESSGQLRTWLERPSNSGKINANVASAAPKIEYSRIVSSSIGVLNLGGLQPRTADGSIGSPPAAPLTALLREIELSLNNGILGPALISALVLPDACGAIEYPEVPKEQRGAKNRYRYIEWYGRYIEPVVDGDFRFAGKAAWRVRNGMIHETGLRFKEFGYDRIIFVPPGSFEIGVGFMRDIGTGDSAFVLDLRAYVETIISGVKRWLDDIRPDQEKQKQMKTLIQLRPEGLSPFFLGVPVLY
jgi:hypothetical protein